MSSVLTYRGKNITWRSSISRTLFRENGPAHITPSGTVIFAQLSVSANCRKRGPTTIQSTGTLFYTNRLGYPHRTDGPAIIYPDGRKAYYVNDQQMLPEEFFLKYGRM